MDKNEVKRAIEKLKLSSVKKSIQNKTMPFFMNFLEK